MRIMKTEIIDAPALRAYLGPYGPWARECGERVTKYRLALAGMTEATLAELVGTSRQTIISIEAGRIVPRDYLRAAIAFALGKNSEAIWAPIKRERVREIGQVA